MYEVACSCLVCSFMLCRIVGLEHPERVGVDDKEN